MRKQFPGHFPKNPNLITEIWKKSIIAFDANAILNLYRYSTENASEFLSVLENNKDRLWLPEQAAYEFLKNRASVIQDQIKAYKNTIEDLTKIQESFSLTRGHPFISKKTKEILDSAISSVTEELEKSKSFQESLIFQDHLKNRLGEIFEHSTGDPYDEEMLNHLFEEGAKRYEKKTPPGYKDGQKHSNPDSISDYRSNFGDWILWKQIMDHSITQQLPVVLVTDDRKEDWWEKPDGKTIGPRPELIVEFEKFTGNHILIYKPESFLLQIKEQLDTKVSKSLISEVEAEHKMRKDAIKRTISDIDIFYLNQDKKNEALINSILSNRASDPIYSEIFTRKKRRNLAVSPNTDEILSRLEKKDLTHKLIREKQEKKINILQEVDAINNALHKSDSDIDDAIAAALINQRNDLLSEISALDVEIQELKGLINNRD